MKYLVLFILIVSSWININAQDLENSFPINPRSVNKVAVNSEIGIKNMTGFGLSFSYYPIANVAIDLGGGVGLRYLKFGLRGRYLFLNKSFTPYIGASMFYNPLKADFPILSYNGTKTTNLDLLPAIFGRAIFGLEIMRIKGFVCGLNAGYTHSFKKVTWTTDFDIEDELLDIIDHFYGGGISIAMNIGYAF